MNKELGFDGVLTSAGNGVYSWAVVLYNGSSASLHCQDAGHLQDDILRRSPARQGAGQPHTNHLREKKRLKIRIELLGEISQKTK